jgi:hypothetical protein
LGGEIQEHFHLTGRAHHLVYIKIADRSGCLDKIG